MKRISSLMSRKSKSNERDSYEKEEATTKNTIPIRILGPRGSGKTSFLYKSYFKYSTDQPDTHFDVIPTPTYNVEIIPYQSQLYELWDFAEISSCLNYIKENTRVIIYMIDSIDSCKETVSSKARENMIWLLENFGKVLENTMIITVANKQDSSNGIMDIQDIGNSWVNDKVLIGLLKGHDWRIFPCNSLTGEGIDIIFDYITTKLEQKRSIMNNRPLSSLLLLSPSPSSIIQEQQQDNIITPWDNLPNPCHFTDKEFKIWFYQGKPFLFFDHWCLIRIIYLTTIMNQHQQQRKQPISLLHHYLENILNHTTDTADNKSIQYSETQTLFWIQMVSFALLKSPVLEGEKNDFEAFLLRCQLKDDCWKDYYTSKLFYSTRASKEFLPPDKKSLPNAFKSSALALKGSGLQIDYQVL